MQDFVSLLLIARAPRIPKNTNTFSRQYADHDLGSEPANLLSPQCFMNSLIWNFDECLHNTLPINVLEGCPEGRSFFPLRLRKLLITWTLTAGGIVHPRMRTHELLKEKYWWENMSHITVDFITDHPESDGKTDILVIIDSFSCLLRLIPLDGLPMTFELGELTQPGDQEVFRTFCTNNQIHLSSLPLSSCRFSAFWCSFGTIH